MRFLNNILKYFKINISDRYSDEFGFDLLTRTFESIENYVVMDSRFEKILVKHDEMEQLFKNISHKNESISMSNNPAWIVGKDLLVRWKISEKDLFQYVKMGLQPYDQYANEKKSPTGKIAEKEYKDLLYSLKGKEGILQSMSITIWKELKLSDYVFWGSAHHTLTTERIESRIYNKERSNNFLYIDSVFLIKKFEKMLPSIMSYRRFAEYVETKRIKYYTWSDYELPSDNECDIDNENNSISAKAVLADLIDSYYSFKDVKNHFREQEINNNVTPANVEVNSEQKEINCKNKFIWHDKHCQITYKGNTLIKTYKLNGIKALAIIIQKNGGFISARNLNNCINPLSHDDDEKVDEIERLVKDKNSFININKQIRGNDHINLKKYEDILNLKLKEDKSEYEKIKYFLLKSLKYKLIEGNDGRIHLINHKNRDDEFFLIHKKAYDNQHNNIDNAINALLNTDDGRELALYLKANITYIKQEGFKYIGELDWYIKL